MQENIRIAKRQRTQFIKLIIFDRIVNCYHMQYIKEHVQHGLSMVTKIKDSKYGIVWSFHRDQIPFFSIK